jgi:hypothetical protein
MEAWGNRVGEGQNGFVKGKWIQQNHLMLQAALHKCRKKRDGGIVFIDFKKAYDSIYHAFIKEVIQDLGGYKWMKLVSNLIGGQAKMMFAGKMGPEFRIYRGVRQGDVVSPLLFNLCLARFLDTLPIEGIEILGRKIKYCAFADDLAILVKNKDDEKLLIKHLELFKEVSGLEINNNKTKFLPFACSKMESKWESVSDFEYLGITLNQLGNVVWTKVLEKVDRKLEGIKSLWWNNQLGVRIKIINGYVLSCLIYYMRADSDITEIEDKVYKMVRDTLGNRGRRVRLNRMMCTHTGYKLWNLSKMDIKMKRSWLSYLQKERFNTLFYSMVNAWNEETKFKANTMVGPIMSWNSLDEYASCWKNIAFAWREIKFYSSILGEIDFWSWKDTSIKKVNIIKICKEGLEAESEDTIFETCDLVQGDISGIEQLKRVHSVKIGTDKNNEIVPIRGCKWIDNDAEIIQSTEAQEEWRKDGIDFVKRIKEIMDSSIPQRIKEFGIELYNINLSVKYKSEECMLCKEVIGSRHYIDKCKWLKKANEFINTNQLTTNKMIVEGETISRLLCQKIIWEINCKLKHKKVKRKEIKKIIKESITKRWNRAKVNIVANNSK